MAGYLAYTLLFNMRIGYFAICFKLSGNDNEWNG